MSYLTQTYETMGVELDPSIDYFDLDSRFLTTEETLRSIPPGKFCDLGCGRGAVIRRVQDHHEVYGTEFDPGLVEFCQRDALQVKLLDLNVADSLPFDSTRFDVIAISEVCEHLLDPRHALTVAYEGLAAGGTMIVTVPNAVPLFARLRLLFGCTVDWLHYPSVDTERTGHLRFYTAESIEKLLREIGFTEVTIRGVSFRMNGVFWARVCHWLPKLAGKPSKASATRIDAWFGRVAPGLSPGLFVECKKKQ